MQEETRLQAAQHRLDEIFAELLGDSEPLPQRQPEPPDLAEECRRFLSWCVGSVVARFGQESSLDLVPLWEEENSLAQQVSGLFNSLWGEEGKTEALAFLAQQLGWKGNPYAALGEYFRGNFWAHHNRLYQNRPIYWLCPHEKHPLLLYYHGLSADTAKKLAKLRQQKMTPQLKQAEKLWNSLDKNLGIAHHILAAAQLGLSKLPPTLARKQKESAL
jgi:hypothetical protein